MPSPVLRIFLPAMFVLAMSSAATADRRHLQTHQHGHLTLQLAIEGAAVGMILEAPGADIVGFEHAAETEAQEAALAAAKANLADPMALFILPEAAGCRGGPATVTLHQKGHHSTFEAMYDLTCSNPSALTELKTRLFELYPNVREIAVEYVTPSGQGAAALAPGMALSIPRS